MTHLQKNHKKILVADDDTAIVDAIQQILEFEGYEVETSINDTTIQKAADIQPAVILLDIWMSGQDGRDITRAIKSGEKTRHIPIILVSANRDTAQIAQLSGADGYLLKPFEMDDLLNIVKKYTE